VFELDEADQLLREAAERTCSSPSTSTTGTPSRCSSRTTPYAAVPSAPGLRHLALRRRGGHQPHPYANLIETQCHGFDMLEHLCGPIDSVAAQMTDLSGRGFSTLVVALHFANGAVGSLVGSYDSSYAYPATHHLEVNGTDAVSWSPTPSAASR
jgi:hypothetical protein